MTEAKSTHLIRRDLTWATALAVGAASTGAAYVYGGWIAWHWIYLAPIAAAGFCLSLYLGIRRSAATGPFRRLAAGFAWASAFVAVLAAPAAMRTARLST